MFRDARRREGWRKRTVGEEDRTGPSEERVVHQTNPEGVSFVHGGIPDAGPTRERSDEKEGHEPTNDGVEAVRRVQSG